MPKLSNWKQEKFCHYVAEGKTKTDAARLAGYTGAGLSGNASQLSKKPHVAQRIEELIAEKGGVINAAKQSQQEEFERKLEDGEITPTWLLAQLKLNVDMARSVGNLAAANKALDMIMKVLGLDDGGGAAEMTKEKEENAKISNARPALDVSKVDKIFNQLSGLSGGVGSKRAPTKSDSGPEPVSDDADE
jgi:hypothetical protein